MPAFHRSFNPYSSAPPPPTSLPDYITPASTIKPLTNEEAGVLIDSFLQTQNGKILTLHRLADYLLGRTRAAEEDNGDIKELEHVIEEERRREGGVVHVQPEETTIDEVEEEISDIINQVPDIKPDKKQARKEERRMKKEKKEQEKRKRQEDQSHDDISASKKSKKLKREKGT
jgi:hypothetical protein